MTATSQAPASYRIAEIASLGPGERVELRIQRKLRSPNEYLGMHWREKSRERKQWQAHLVNALVTSLPFETVRALVSGAILAGGRGGCSTRRRVDVQRGAPGRRNFIRDDDNLRFAVKPVLDALKHVGLIRDDLRKWIDLPPPTQFVTDDNTFWTSIVIDAPKEPTA